MAVTRRIKSSKGTAPQRGAQSGPSGVQRVPPALQEITLTPEEAEELERIMARQSIRRGAGQRSCHQGREEKW